jgi:CDP-paratose 2-epimerase
MSKRIVITGSSGLVGRSCTELFLRQGYDVYGIDNNARATYFGPDASTKNYLPPPDGSLGQFKEFDLDITDRSAVQELIRTVKPHAIVHTAAQPSHDKAAEIPFLDFETNAVGTLNLIESFRQSDRKSVV